MADETVTEPQEAVEPEYVEALWVGPYQAFTGDGAELVPGVTVYDRITKGEAESSAYWQYPVEPRKALKDLDKAELEQRAQEVGAEVPGNASKAQLVSAILAATKPQDEVAAPDQPAEGEGEG